ncbi:hypothetical protein [Streptomyces sp. NPDC052107]|jgi:hypothetical protein|uniref:hypothetical protein n=1 Tax=Streptomyces sp. NPDC052107 TaxID=3155632 RepID=UPI00341B8D8E
MGRDTPVGKAVEYKWVVRGDQVIKSEVETNWVIVQLKYIGKDRAHPHGKWVVYTSYLEG